MEAFCKDDSLRFDCIIVDEGQDLLENWWVALDGALIDGGSIRVFFDSNQHLYSHHSEFVSDLDLVPIPLNRNLRNTQRIHDASMVHYSGLVTTAPRPLGMELKWVETGALRNSQGVREQQVRRIGPATGKVFCLGKKAARGFLDYAGFPANRCRLNPGNQALYRAGN